MNIVLIGLRGSGKTTVGRIIADTLNRRFIDVDDYIEKKYSTTIAKIFRTKGETYFRSLEEKAIVEITKTENIIIAPGGGAVVSKINVDNLKKNSAIFALCVDPETLLKRITRDPKSSSLRPPLTRFTQPNEVKELLNKRAPIYQKVADFTVDGNLSPQKIARQIIKIFNEISTS